jgi:phosphate transport system substrate-binding protein
MFIFRSINWLLIFVIIGCNPVPVKKSETFRIRGSDTMLVLMENLARNYMMTHLNKAIYVEGGGTASGIDALIEENIDICSASRLLLPEESNRLSKKHQSVGYYTRVAKDALSIYVHPKNFIKDITLKQLKLIFSGQIKNWKEIGGYDRQIAVVIRPPNSGTYQYFKEHILQDQNYSNQAITLPTTQQIVDRVMQDMNAIGYGGIAYGPENIHCRINGIRPSADNVRFDLYPISRYLYLYTISKPTGHIGEFIDWIMTAEGQSIVQETGYISILSTGK